MNAFKVANIVRSCPKEFKEDQRRGPVEIYKIQNSKELGKALTERTTGVVWDKAISG